MSTYALISIGRLGGEQLIAEYTSRREALKARDDLFEQNALHDHREETYVVYDGEQEHEWDDEAYCAQCQDVPVKVGQTCSECLSELAEYYHTDEGGSN